MQVLATTLLSVHNIKYSGTSEKGTFWDQVVCPLYRGCPLLRGSNRIILIGSDKFGDLVLSIVERYLIQCPFLGGPL